jgi:hypothetical protein
MMRAPTLVTAAGGLTQDSMAETRTSLHILVVAPGHDPAGVIERAVLRLGGEERMPHEIRVVAPRRRLAEVQRDLLGPGGAVRFGQLCERAGFPRDEILFNQRTLHPLEANGEEDCLAIADRLLDLLRRLSSQDAAVLTVAVAEDAGLASHLLHCCMQVIARTADRLVLFPSGAAVDETVPRSVVSASPEIEIPLLLWPATEPVPATYAEAVAVRRSERRRASRRDVLRLDRRRRTVAVGEASLTLPAMQFFWLYYLASTPGERFPLAELTSRFGAGNRHHPYAQKLSDGTGRTFPADLHRAFVQLFPFAADKFDAMYRRACGPNPGLPSTISKINAALRRGLGRGAGPYLIEGGRGAGGYRIPLPSSAIQIVGAEVKRA